MEEHLQGALDAIVDLAVGGNEGAKSVLEWVEQVSNSGEITIGLPADPSAVLKLLSEVGRSAETFAMARMIAHYVASGEAPDHLTVKISADFESLR